MVKVSPGAQQACGLRASVCHGGSCSWCSLPRPPWPCWSLVTASFSFQGLRRGPHWPNLSDVSEKRTEAQERARKAGSGYKWQVLGMSIQLARPPRCVNSLQPTLSALYFTCLLILL